MRAKWIPLLRNKGCSLGEAVEATIKDIGDHWVVDGVYVPPPRQNSAERSRNSSVDMSSPPAAKKQKRMFTAKVLDGKTICKPYNDARGCQERCPFPNSVHACDVLVGSTDGKNGKVCGSKQHSRLGHHFR